MSFLLQSNHVLTYGYGTYFDKVHNWRQNWSLLLTFENIFDGTYKKHGSGVYSPGRNLVVGVRFRK